MKKNFGPKTYFFPLPVLIIGTYDEKNNANAMNAAWGGIHDTNEVCLCLSSDHKTTKNIALNKEFTIAFATKSLVKESDYLGIRSGNDVGNKLEKCGLTVSKSAYVNAPVINEYPVSLDCKVKSMYADENETTFIVASIMNVSADEKVLDANGKIDVNKCEFISYNPSSNTYNLMGESVGSAFKDGLKIK